MPARSQEPNHPEKKRHTHQTPSDSMPTCELKPSQEREDLQASDYDEDGESQISGFSDDSDEDPTFDIVEEAREKLSRMSLKKSRPRISKENGVGSEDMLESMGVEIPELDEKDGKCFEMVEKLIGDGQLGKLKVDQCKVYLRKYGLRLTGNKDVLIARIREHLEVLDGGGEKKYPVSCFVLNCKGDACTGDVVMFEQNVYEMYSIASRSATGPPCGTRTVAGRIVKESYGSAKQQHTFTIEVLWSKGEKPLPPLHPLLIKGRNLYKLKTMRKRWVDEEDRRKVLQEKHSRGSLARFSRENRIQDKEMRKMGGMKRMKENKSDCIPSKQGNQMKVDHVVRNQELPHCTIPIESNVPKKANIQNEHQSIDPIKYDRQKLYELHNNIIQAPKLQNGEFGAQNSILGVPKPHEYQAQAWPHFHATHEQYRQPGAGQRYSHQRQPLSTLNSPRKSPRPQREYQAHVRPHFHAEHEQHRQPFPASNSNCWSPRPWQICRYYRQGRCYYGDACKYLHD